eukprot:TRINITY_DN28504_c0_g1_i1.p1 TRINITY_DN28504_c0_g1~~TRINITY_DN28504_c0_g1_i1.p1  ORF type:complete len:327 (-),score=62.62 TRINITY_DN28504_c0_g1_i1:379-1359(-)
MKMSMNSLRVLLCALISIGFATGSQRVTVVGHRGNSQYAPENTLIALEAALLLSDGFETDLRFSSDGHVVLIHDEWTNRTTNATWRVANHTLDELRTLDAGSWFGPQFSGAVIPTFDEAMELLARYPGKVAVLDHKVESLAPSIAAIVNKYGVADRVIASCWTPTQLSDARQYLPDSSRQVLTNTVPVNTTSYFAQALQQGAAGWSALYSQLTPDFVRDAHRRLLSVVAWTVQNLTVVDELMLLGIDGIISNDPGGVKVAVTSYEYPSPPPSFLPSDDSAVQRATVIAWVVGPIGVFVGAAVGILATALYLRWHQRRAYFTISEGV